MMILGGIAELFLGVNAERRSLEDIAEPLTASGSSSANDAGGAQPAGAAGVA